MIKDFRYIIKRVIIGVLICIAISCINSCKVKALNNETITFVIPNTEELFSYDLDIDTYPYYYGYMSNVTYDNTPAFAVYFAFSDSPFVYSGMQTDNCGNGLSIYCYGSMNSNSNNKKRVSLIYNRNTGAVLYDGRETPSNFSNGRNYIATYNYEDFKNYVSSFNYSPYGFPYLDGGVAFITSNDIYDFNNNLVLTKDYINILISNVPSILKIDSAPLIKNNILVEMSLFPYFTIFDTDNYDYQYGFASDNELPNIWLSLDTDAQWLQFRSNGTVFVRIKDKSTNEIIDTATFTIDNMGRPVEDEDAYIDISSEYRTENYLNNNISSSSYSKIKEVQLYLDYNPKSSFYRYFYQYIPVNNGEYATEPNNNNWEELGSSNNGSRTYVVSQNGVMFAKMEDKDGNVVATANYKVENIGDLASDNPNENNTNAWYNRIGKKLNFGGPIGSLINIPITLLRTIYNGVNGVGGVCYSYNLGSLWGTNLSLPCVNLSHYLGALYTTIDIICSSVMIYYIFKMLTMAYDKFLRMERDPLSAEDFYRDNKD